MTSWKRFVLQHGWRARAVELAAVVGQPVEDVLLFRSAGACTRLKKCKRFDELFRLWHGRQPRDDEWPAPRRSHRGSYDWQAPELALLASLVGRLGTVEISKVLTKRLRERTGDRRAMRSRWAVLIGMQRIGMQTNDVIGGIRLADAGREIGAYAIVFQAIERGKLRAFRVGRLWVIPHAAWAAWKATRVFPPPGHVQLSTIKKAMAIRSDKLSEFARAGHIQTALRCNPYGSRAKSTRWGSWYVSRQAADKLVADRRAGRPMPWHGKPEPGNLRVTFKLWRERRHPASCRTCRQIWGRKGPPRSYADYIVRYHPLAHGAKRHLTRKWSPGLTMKQVAKITGRSWGGVRNAVENGMLVASRVGVCRYISRTEMTRWKARKCPTGGSQKSWLSLAAAAMQYGFTRGELRAFVRQRKLRAKVGTDGAMRGIAYVARHQCAHLREKIGFTEEQAARRAGVTLPRFRALLEGVNWREAAGIPLETVQAVIKRIESREGYTIEAAATALGTTEEWVRGRILDGTIRVSRAKWDRRRLYITEPMLERLKNARRIPLKRDDFDADWLFLSEAAAEAGVSLAQMNNWGLRGEVRRRPSHLGWRYPRIAVRARAKAYWEKPRLKRAVPPAWLQLERGQRAANDDLMEARKFA